MHRTTRRRALTTLLLALGARLNAQSMEPYVPVRPNDAWRTLETAHFVFHFPRDLDEWTRDVATRIEGERDAVRRLVGFAPPERVTVLVADPYNGPSMVEWEQLVHSISDRLHEELAVEQPGEEGGHDPE